MDENEIKVEIPLSVGYLITKSGKVFKPDGNLSNQYTHKKYVTVSVPMLNRMKNSIGLHRLLALTFIPDDRDKTDLEVNHRDLDPSNNGLDNLEWVTNKQNNIHADLFRKDNQYPMLIAYEDDEPVALYKNVWEAEAAIGLSRFAVWDSVKDNKSIPHNSGDWQFFHRPFYAGVPISLRNSTMGSREKETGRPAERAVKMRDVDSGEVVHFSTMNDAARHHNASASHIYQSIQNGDAPRMFRKQWQVAYLAEEFVELTPEELHACRTHGPKEVMAFNYDLGRYAFYASGKAFYKTEGLTKGSVTNVLKANSFRRVNEWVFTYLTPENAAKLKQLVENPVPTVCPVI